MTRGSIYAGKAVILIQAQDAVDNTLRGVENKFKRTANLLSGMGQATFRTGFFASIGQGLLLKRFARFDDLLLELRVKMGLLGQTTAQQEAEFSRLEVRIRQLGKTTSYTTQEVAEGAIKLAQAGLSGAAIEDTLQPVLDLARGTTTDLDNAARILANSMATFKLDTKQAGEIVSQFVQAARLGTVEIDDLSQSLKYASATATDLGQTLPSVLAMFTLISERGLRGSIAGTSFNTALGQIAKKAEDISAAFGFDVPVDTQGNLMLTEFLNLLDRATAQMGSLERVGVFQDLFNLRGVRSISPITNPEDIRKLIDLTNSISEAGNEARLAAIVMDSGLGGSARRAISALEDLNITLGKMVDDYLIPMLDVLPPIANFLDQLARRYTTFTLALLASPAALLASGVGMIGLSLALRRLAGGVALMRGAWNGMMTVLNTGLIARVAASLSGKSGATKLKAASSFLSSIGTGIAAKAASTPIVPSVRASNKQIALLQRQMGLHVASLGIRRKELDAIEAGTSALRAENIQRARANGLIAAHNRSLATNNARIVAARQVLARTDKEGLQRVVNTQGKITAAMEAYRRRQEKVAQIRGGSRRGDLGTALLGQDQARKRVDDLKKRLRDEAKTVREARKGALAKLASSPIQKPLAGLVSIKSVKDLELEGKAVRGEITRTTQSIKGSQAALAGARSTRPTILSQIMSGLGRTGRGATSIAKLGAVLGKTALKAGKFIFSFNGVMAILQLLLVFGDRIPFVADAFARLGAGIAAAFGQIFAIGQRVGPAFALIGRGFELLNNQDTKEVGFQAIIDGLSGIVAVVTGSLRAAWHSFFQQLDYVWDRIKLITVGIWELISVIVTNLTTALGNVFGQIVGAGGGILSNISNLFGGKGPSSFLAGVDYFIKGVALFLAQLSTWVADFIIQTTNMFSWFLEELELVMYRVVNALAEAIPIGGSTARDNAEQGTLDVIAKRNARQAALAEDSARINEGMAKFQQNLANLSNATTGRDAARGVSNALEDIQTSMWDTWNRLRALDNVQGAQPQLQPSAPGNVPQPAPPVQANEIKKITRGFAAALVGSAALTRGNVTRAVTEEELKKQTELLEAIKTELEDANQNSGARFRQ